jgi:hypothetical protein
MPDFLLGPITRAELERFPGWPRLVLGKVDEAALGVLRAGVERLELVVFLATWCPDSTREVPRLLAICDAIGLPPERLQLIGLDWAKGGVGDLTKKWAITCVPTVILLRQGREIGRFVERPARGSTLEADLAAVVRQATTVTY